MVISRHHAAAPRRWNGGNWRVGVGRFDARLEVRRERRQRMAHVGAAEPPALHARKLEREVLLRGKARQWAALGPPMQRRNYTRVLMAAADATTELYARPKGCSRCNDGIIRASKRLQPMQRRNYTRVQTAADATTKLYARPTGCSRCNDGIIRASKRQPMQRWNYTRVLTAAANATMELYARPTGCSQCNDGIIRASYRLQPMQRWNYTRVLAVADATTELYARPSGCSYP